MAVAEINGKRITFFAYRALKIACKRSRNSNFRVYGVNSRVEKLGTFNNESPLIRLIHLRLTAAVERIIQHLHQAEILFIFHINNKTTPTHRRILIIGNLLDCLGIGNIKLRGIFYRQRQIRASIQQ